MQSKKSEVELQGEDDTLMGRLAKRMAARDYIDRFDLGTSAKKVAKAATADCGNPPMKINVGSMAAEIAKGIKIEQEHTKDKSIEKKIASDHLKEHPLYYDEKVGLPAMEERLTKLESNMADQAKNAGNVYGELPKKETFK